MVSMLGLPLKELIGLLVVLVFVVMLWLVLPKTVAAASARANVFELAKAIDRACYTGATGSNPVVVENFVMPQSIIGGKAGSMVRFVPAHVINSVGDPNYLVYYEMFPVGEALSWEIYQRDFGHRAISYISSGPEITLNSFKSFIDAKMAKYDEYTRKQIQLMREQLISEGKSPDEAQALVANSGLLKLSGLLVGNVVIDPLFNPQTGGVTGETDDISILGEWEDQSTGGGKTPFFRFKNYVGQPAINKSLVKYMACRDNSLCLKTPDGVMVFPLPSCANSNIDYIQLDKKEQGIGREDITEFYLASPCKVGKIKIKVDKCKVSDECMRKLDFPVYGYDKTSGSLKSDGAMHTECVNVFYNNDNGDPADDLSPISSPDFNCIKIELDNKNEHCVTDYHTDTFWRSALEKKTIAIGAAVGVAAGVGLCAAGIIGGFFTFGLTAVLGCSVGAMAVGGAVWHDAAMIDAQLIRVSKDFPMKLVTYYLDDKYYLLKPVSLLPLPTIDFVGIIEDSWTWP